MADSERDALFSRTEATLTQWATQDADAHRGLSDQVGKVKEALDALVAGAERRRDDASGMAQGIRGDIEALQASLSDQATSSKKAQHRIGQQEKTIAKLKEQATASQRRIADLERDLAERSEAALAAEEQTKKLQGDLEGRRQAADEAQRQAAQAEQRFAERKDAGQAAQQRVAQLERELAQVTEEQTSSREGAGRLEQKVADLTAQVSALSEELERSRSNEQATALDLDVTMADLTQAREEAEALSGVEGHNQELRMLLDAERRRGVALEGKLQEETAKGTKSALAQQLAEALREAEEAHDQVRELRERLEQVRRGNGEEAPLPDEPPASSNAGPAPSAPRGSERRTCGEILMDAGLITQEQLDLAFEEHRKSPQRPLALILIEREWASEDAVGQAVACESNVPFVRLQDEPPDTEAVALLSGRLARLHTCIPVRTSGGALVLAMTNPLDLVAIEDIERTTSLTVDPVVAVASEIAQAIAEHYEDEA